MAETAAKRPDELTPEGRAAIVAGYGAGIGMGAAHLAGVSKATLRRWMREGRRNPESPCGRLRLEVRAAFATEVRHALKRVGLDAAKGDKSARRYLREHDGADVAAWLRELEDPNGEDDLS